MNSVFCKSGGNCREEGPSNEENGGQKPSTFRAHSQVVTVKPKRGVVRQF